MEESSGQLRLNFSHASEEQADAGLAKLAALVRGDRRPKPI
jgi:2-aminoadipate transaminase